MSARYTVIVETLTDGSKVYNVLGRTDCGALIEYACTSKGAAADLADVLARTTIDVHVKEPTP
jgi:hypothetical protein